MPREALENTIRAFELALEAGADAIELDVHCTSDGVPVVHHDPVLGDGSAIASLNARELVQRDANRARAIPILAAVCELVARRATLFVEVKGMGIERQVLETLRHQKGDFAIHSFDHALVARAHHIDPSMRLGVLLDKGTSWSVEHIAALMSSTGASDLWPHHSLVTGELVDAVHARRGCVFAWTVNSPRLARTLALLRVDGLCSDDVRRMPH